MVQPPQRVEIGQIPPREYIFVLDVSGSMHGFPLDTAKVLMRELIGGLRPTDSFNVILFSGGSRLLAPRSLPATAENVSQAIAEIERESGGGGTELGQALEQALALPENKGVSRTTIVVTDGFISAEASVFEGIRKNLNRSNLFAFGIGSSVNRHLIEGMARAGQGEPFVAIDGDEAKEVAKRFQEYVRLPALTDIAVHTDGFETYDVEPLSIPDLFADRPLVVFGKWRGIGGSATGTIRVTGVGGVGGYENVFDAAEAESSEDNRALRYLWARERVKRLSDDGSENEETRLAVTELGLNYELLTRYTSFVAVHEVIRNPNGQAKNVNQPLPLPQGVEDSAVAVPEPELALLLMLVLLLLGMTRVRRAWS
jgi:Ca-activated chloride channel family protein